jgi:hypothetical protein
MNIINIYGYILKGSTPMVATDTKLTEESYDDIRTDLVRIYIRRKRRKGIELTVEDIVCRFPISESEAEELLSEVPYEWKTWPLFRERMN